jgi:hypothetical protein
MPQNSIPRPVDGAALRNAIGSISFQGVSGVVDFDDSQLDPVASGLSSLPLPLLRYAHFFDSSLVLC